MENYKIKRNPKKLTDEQIDRHKDFSKLLSNQQKLHRFQHGTKPLYKNLGFMCMMIVVGIVLLMLVLDEPEAENAVAEIAKDTTVVKKDPAPQTPENQLISTSPSEKTTTIETPEKKQINTPVISYDSFTIDAESGGVIYTKSGLRLLIPSFAFANAGGSNVKKAIVKYRELSSLKEASINTEPSFAVAKSFELIAVSSESNTPLSFSKAIAIESIATLKEQKGNLYFFNNEKWESTGKETVAFRFNLQSNDTQFPQYAVLRTLVWEIPSEAGSPSDFNYIFNRSWKDLSFRTVSGKKEMTLKTTNSSYKIMVDLAPISGELKKENELKEAFFTLSDLSTKNTDQQKEASQTIESWKNSSEGKEYQNWLKNDVFDVQFSTASKISKFSIPAPGVYCISYVSGKPSSISTSKRVLTLEKYPEKGQQYNTEMKQE